MTDRPVPSTGRHILRTALIIISVVGGLLGLQRAFGWDPPGAVVDRLQAEQVTDHQSLHLEIGDSSRALRAEIVRNSLRLDSSGARFLRLDSTVNQIKGLQETQLALVCLNTPARDLELARAPCDRLLTRRGVIR